MDMLCRIAACSLAFKPVLIYNLTQISYDGNDETKLVNSETDTFANIPHL